MSAAHSLRMVPVHEEAAWERVVPRLPLHHILQSWAWGAFKSRWGWRPYRYQWVDADGHVRAAAQVLRRAIPGTPFGVAYVPKGPLFDPDDAEVVARVLADLEQEARRLRAIWLKIDADVPADHLVVLPLLAERGWRYSPEQVQFRNTAVIDLTLDEDTLLANMHQKTRYNIRLAMRRGVQVRVGTADDLPLFYAMYRETGRRNGFLVRPEAYYLDVWRDFLQRGLAHVLLADVEGETVAGLILFRYGDTVWYFYGASTNKHRNLMPTYLLQWEAIRWGKAVGARTYDLWGAPEQENENDPLWGVWRFKRGFGATLREQMGAWDYPVSRIGYWAMWHALPRVRALWRRMKQSASGSD